MAERLDLNALADELLKLQTSDSSKDGEFLKNLGSLLDQALPGAKKEPVVPTVPAGPEAALAGAQASAPEAEFGMIGEFPINLTEANAPPVPEEEEEFDLGTALDDILGAPGRIVERGAKHIRKTREGMHIGFTPDTERKLSGLVGPDVPLPLRAFNRVILEGPVEAMDAGMLLFQGTLGSLAQVAEEFGVDSTTTNQLIRDVNLMVIHSMGKGGAPIIPGVKPTAPAAVKAAAVKKAAINKATAKLPKGKKEAAQAALDEAITPLEGLKQAIADPAFREAADAASLSITDRAIANVFDRLLPIKRIGEGEKNIIPYEEMRLLSGNREVVRSVLEHGTIKWSKKGDIIFNGESLHGILKPIMHKADDAAAYFVARRSGELLRRGKEGLVTAEQVKAGMELGKKNPEFRTAFEAYQKFNTRVLDFAEQSGLINKAGRKAMAEANMNYVPFYRVDMPSKPRFGRRITGRKVQLRDIYENMTLNAAQLVDLSLKNRAKQQVYEQFDRAGMIGKEGSGKAIERLGPRQEFVKLIDKDLAPKLKELGIEADTQLFRALSFRQSLGKNTDGILVDGKWQFYKVNDPYLLNAVNAYEPSGFPMSVRMLGAFPKLLLTRMITMEPGFIAMNTIRDTQTAYINSQGGFVPGVSSIKGLASRMRNTPEYWEYLANGGGISTLFKSEVETALGMRDFYTRKGIDYNRVLDTPRKLERGLEELTSAFETSARLAEFELVKKNLQGGGEARPLRRAALAGRDVSVDFGKMGGGKTTQFFTTTAPFFNAGLQGILRLGEVAKENPTRTAMRGTTAITLPSLMLYAANKDQDWYKATPDWIKDLHWMVQVPGTDKIFLIPKGFEFGAIFGTIPERIFEGVEQQYGKRFADRMLSIMAHQLRLDPTPQFAKVPLEQLTNETFTGAPIVPTNMLEDVAPHEQFRPWTSETMVEMAKILKEDAGLEMSPARTEALVRQIFGTLGTYILEGSDASVRMATGKVPPTPRIDETPVIKRFFRQLPLRQTQYEIDFYELLHATRQTVGTFAKIAKEARTPEFRTDQEKKLFALQSSVEVISNANNSLTKQLQSVMLDDTLSAKEKAEARDKIYARRNQLFERFMSSVPEDILREEGLGLGNR
jgi:hypothetical protein